MTDVDQHSSKPRRTWWHQPGSSRFLFWMALLTSVVTVANSVFLVDEITGGSGTRAAMHCLTVIVFGSMAVLYWANRARRRRDRLTTAATAERAR